MELRVLKYFLTVADEGNITRAADILHVTQPTLSRQMKELEDEMGTTLLIRGKRSVTLTEEGFLFKQQAETIVELADKLELHLQIRRMLSAERCGSALRKRWAAVRWPFV